ncbi:putative transposase number 2 of insertion sequence NGRIS-36a (plasmid) [Sinorhizobium fredii NGR234]|uniref:Putative insertion sequence ATP-binding protein y4uH n=1 Tax=Sinorhizobium fredii (strain NBRC 101917 / NGR234) TaxID=394 RepID=Y4UH_SINFN|nr:IS21-like element helper ATPase IstB [Sinorhizobium fredii]Q53200.1 RecName: Full=Putative insertion sequence ATP-binding protein y4uH [Sinorhizobium fredii NGR234]AAB91880.1 putative transposase number 2 of insertion sequence NGRIS-36a [Sinorhizobium fredii NGR234]CAA92407.1 transposase homologue [Rhizobium sp.]
MLKHPTLNLLQQLGLAGMADAFTRLADNDESDNLSHGEWLALLLDQEATWRNNKRLALRLRNAKLHHPAVPEDIIRRAPREYDRTILDLLIAGDWIRKHENCAIVGPTGIGKSWLACALGHKACRDNHSVLYVRMPALLQSLEQARGIGSLATRLKSLGAVELLILDDYGLQPIDGNAPHYLLEILEGRYGRRSTLVTSQFPVARWHEKISDPTYADAILDRLVHNAHRLEMSGESMRRLRQPAEIQT